VAAPTARCRPTGAILQPPSCRPAPFLLTLLHTLLRTLPAYPLCPPACSVCSQQHKAGARAHRDGAAGARLAAGNSLWIAVMYVGLACGACMAGKLNHSVLTSAFGLPTECFPPGVIYAGMLSAPGSRLPACPPFSVARAARSTGAQQPPFPPISPSPPNCRETTSTTPQTRGTTAPCPTLCCGAACSSK